MGHKSLAISERYSHLSPDHKKHAVNSLNAFFKKKSGQPNQNEMKQS